MSYNEIDNHIVYNAIQTPDGTILESRDRHDYVTHVDANGEEYMNDGGKSYLRRNNNEEMYKDLTVYNDDPHEEVREVLTWGTYGIDGNQPIKYLKLKDMDTKHIQEVLQITRLDGWRRSTFINELDWRGVEV